MAQALKTALVRTQDNVMAMACAGRNLSRSATNCEKPVAVSGKASAVEDTKIEDVKHGSHKHEPNFLQKQFLVWSGKYKSVDEVPSRVAEEKLEKARSVVRIRLSNVVVVGTMLCCFFAAISGKNAHDRGESAQHINMDWHENPPKEEGAE